ESLTIPNSVTSIGVSAFEGCHNMTTLKILGPVGDIGYHAFNILKNTTVYYGGTKSQLEAACTAGGSNINDNFNVSTVYNSGSGQKVFYFKCGDNLWYRIQDNTVSISKEISTGSNLAMWDWSWSGNFSPFNQCANEFTAVSIRDATTIGEYAFYNCDNMQSFYPSGVSPEENAIIVPNTISATGLGKGAFEGCSSIQTVKFQSTSQITTINESVFNSCTSLNNIVIPDTVTAFGARAFRVCSSLEKVVIPSLVVSIGENAFENTTNGLKFYCKNATNKTDLGTKCKNDSGTAQGIAYSFPNHANQIFYFGCGDNLWYELTDSDTTATIFAYPSDAADKTMWNWTPNDATHPTPSSFTSLASTLTTINFGDAATIGSYAFNGCGNISRVDIPNAIANVMDTDGTTVLTYAIGSYAFTGLASGADIYYDNDETVKSNPEADLTGKCDTSITNCFGYTVNSVAANHYVFHFKCGNHLWYSVDGTTSSNKTATIVGDGYVPSGTDDDTTQNAFAMWDYSTDTSAMSPFFYQWNAIVSVSISDATTIGQRAFYHCTNITGTLIIPNSVTSIGISAFSSCNNISGALTIPSSVTNLGGAAFMSCRNLTSVTVPSSVTSMGMQMFESCTGLTSASINCTFNESLTFYGCTSLVSATLSDSQTTIPMSTFDGCTSLANFTIPSAVATISQTAFFNCSSLDDITIPTGVTRIQKNAFAGLKSGANIRYNGKQAAFESKCATSVANCFGFAVDSTDTGHYIFHFTQDITYVPNDGTMPSPVTPTTYETNSGSEIVLPTPTRANSNFEGWCTDSALTTTPITSFTPVNNNYLGDKTFYAKWTVTSRSIIYYCQYGAIPSPTTTSYVPGSGLTLTLDKPTRSGYAFCGWYTPANVTLTDIDVVGGLDGEKEVDTYIGDGYFTFLVGDHTEDVSFYAKWYQREDVTYWENGQSKVLLASTPYEIIKLNETTLGTPGQDTWYVLKDDAVNYSYVSGDSLTILGNVKIILKDNCDMLCSKINVDAPNSLTIYAQQSDSVYNAPVDTSNSDCKQVLMRTNYYYLINGKRYYRYNYYDGDYGTFEYLYEPAESKVYMGTGNDTYELDPSLSKKDVLAIPKSYTQGDFTDDNDDVYTWHSGSPGYFTIGDKEYRFYQQDSSADGYKYYVGSP
ncbi:MAG: leucine-rich repeat protein, partial [Clostridia bacterium]|nr:leucine-rich repeat protein [Clostridia bacterium]